MLNLNLTTAPTATLCSLAELKRHLMIEHNLQDATLNDLLQDITSYIEHECNQCFVPQTWTEIHPYFYCETIALIKGPILELTVEYYNHANVLTEFEDFTLIQNKQQTFVHSDNWPTAVYDRPDGVVFTCACGFDAVPPFIRRAALRLAADWYEDRGDKKTGMDEKVEKLINAARRGHIG